MFIIPVFNKSDAKTPYVCLALIVVNVFIYFFVQGGDNQIQQEAYEYYDSSGLMVIECTAYRDYLVAAGEEVSPEVLKKKKRLYPFATKMFRDRDFQEELIANRIITAEQQQYKEWREKRDTFEQMTHKSITYRYGYSPQRKNMSALFSYMFLHGSVMHLVGNMVFLWLVGAVLEKAVGVGRFLVLYIITGICAGALFGICYPQSPGPLVGASGAIAGLMGAYGIIFGLRKIRIFYSLGFYFNYASVPAIVLFPIWLANEFFQLYTQTTSNVAYVAHIGGLLSGILIGGGYKITSRDAIDALFQKEEKKNKLELLLQNGMNKMVELDLPGARNDFCNVLKLSPQHRTAIRQLYAIDKTKPESEEFHKSTHRLLQSIQYEDCGEYLNIFGEYKSLVKKVTVPNEVLEQLTHCYLAGKKNREAEVYLATLMKRAPENTKIPGFLMALASTYSRSSHAERAEKCYRILVSRYPTSAEGMKAGELLGSL